MIRMAKFSALAILALAVPIVVFLLVFSGGRAEATGGLSALDGTWRLTELKVNSITQTIPTGTNELRFIVDTAAPAMRREFWNTEGNFEHDEAHFDIPNVAFRAPANFTSTDLQQIQAAGLSAGSLDGVADFDVAPSIQAKVAFQVLLLTGGVYEATLTVIYQSGPWTLPTAEIYAPRPAGSGGAPPVSVNPSGNRTLTSMKWQR